jgi:hypothetical protein
MIKFFCDVCKKEITNESNGDTTAYIPFEKIGDFRPYSGIHICRVCRERLKGKLRSIFTLPISPETHSSPPGSENTPSSDEPPSSPTSENRLDWRSPEFSIAFYKEYKGVYEK